jgi:hypothetical protein
VTPEKQAILDALVAERYGPSLWFTSRPRTPKRLLALMDDQEACAQRRLELVAAWDEDMEETACG